MPTSTGNPALLAKIDIPESAGQLPQSGQPLTEFDGLKLNFPLQKLYMSGAVRRDSDSVAFGNGGLLAASTSYTGWCAIPRAALITMVYFIIGQAPTGANCTLSVTANGVSLLSTANYTVNSTTPIGTIISIPLATGPLNSILVATAYPYLQVQTSGFPYPILCTYAEGATTVHSSNVAVFVEFEPDDFNG